MEASSRSAPDRRSRRQFDPFAIEIPDDDRRELPVPLLIGGALTSAAISLAGAAAFVAWRWTRTEPHRVADGRAARAVREARVSTPPSRRVVD